MVETCFRDGNDANSRSVRGLFYIFARSCPLFCTACAHVKSHKHLLMCIQCVIFLYKYTVGFFIIWMQMIKVSGSPQCVQSTSHWTSGGISAPWTDSNMSSWLTFREIHVGVPARACACILLTISSLYICGGYFHKPADLNMWHVRVDSPALYGH